MEKEQFDEIREFAKSLNAKRQQMSDGPLLDQCQQHLDALVALVAHLADEFEEAPHVEEEPEQSATADRLVSALHPEPPPEPRAGEPKHHEMQPVAEGILRAHQSPHHKKAPTKKHR